MGKGISTTRDKEAKTQALYREIDRLYVLRISVLYCGQSKCADHMLKRFQPGESLLDYRIPKSMSILVPPNFIGDVIPKSTPTLEITLNVFLFKNIY